MVANIKLENFGKISFQSPITVASVADKTEQIWDNLDDYNMGYNQKNYLNYFQKKIIFALKSQIDLASQSETGPMRLITHKTQKIEIINLLFLKLR